MMVSLFFYQGTGAFIKYISADRKPWANFNNFAV